MADEALVRDWLGRLGRFTAAFMASDEAAIYVDDFAPMLASRFDNGAFCWDSLEHVAAESRHLPTYGELVPILTAWWREHRPYVPAVTYDPPAETQPERTPEELEHVTRLV